MSLKIKILYPEFLDDDDDVNDEDLWMSEEWELDLDVYCPNCGYKGAFRQIDDPLSEEFTAHRYICRSIVCQKSFIIGVDSTERDDEIAEDKNDMSRYDKLIDACRI